MREAMAAAYHVCQTGCMLMTADTLKYLYMGGRIGRARHLVGTLLNIKPIISMQEGIIVAAGQTRSITQAFARIVELMAERGAADGPIKVGITHAPERAKKMLQAVSQSYDCCQVLTSQLSPVLGVHTGVGTVGVNFFPVPPEPAW